MNRTGWIVLGLVLLAFALGSLFLEGISYVTEETVVEAGPLELTAERSERIGLPTWLSAVLALAGAGALAVGLKRPGSA
jgi:hypothetical protein